MTYVYTSSIAIGNSRVFVQNMLHLVSQIKCRHSNVVKGKEVIILLKYDISGLPVEVLHQVTLQKLWMHIYIKGIKEK